MARSSISGGERTPAQPSGRDIDSLGPSDSSDTGSDVQGERRMPTRPDQPDEMGAIPAPRGSDSDALGTGERGSATGQAGDPPDDAADILPDRVVDADDVDEDDDARTARAAAERRRQDTDDER